MNDNNNNTGFDHNNSNQQDLGQQPQQNQPPQQNQSQQQYQQPQQNQHQQQYQQPQQNQQPFQNQQPPYQNTTQNQQQYGYTNNYGYPYNYSQPQNMKKKGISTRGIVAIIFGAFIGFILLIISTLVFWGIIEKNIESYSEYSDSSLDGADNKTAGFYGKVFTFSDGSTLYFNYNGTYLWYKDKNVTNDNYFEGTYVVDSGADASDKITNEFSSYGVTNEELERLYLMNEGSEFTQDNLICIVMTSQKRIINKVDVLKEDDVVPYMGFYDGESYSLANMESGNDLTITSVENQ